MLSNAGQAQRQWELFFSYIYGNTKRGDPNAIKIVRHSLHIPIFLQYNNGTKYLTSSQIYAAAEKIFHHLPPAAASVGE